MEGKGREGKGKIFKNIFYFLIFINIFTIVYIDLFVNNNSLSRTPYDYRFLIIHKPYSRFFLVRASFAFDRALGCPKV